MEFYKNITSRWRAEIKPHTVGKKIFSPYLTSKIAESITETSLSKEIDVYTLFSAELFASKASSLLALRKIIKQGHRVFHLPDLHAKIFIIPTNFCSIGSQNLTNKGMSNKEISIGTIDKKLIASLEKKIQPWLEERIPISLEMISDMEIEIKKIEKDFSEAKRKASLADDYVFEKHKTRLAAQELEKRRAFDLLSRKSRVTNSIGKLSKSGASAFCTVREVASSLD